MTLPRVVGLDLSLTATGIAHPDGTTNTINPGDLRDEPRLDDIVSHVLDAATATDLVALEGLSHGAKGSSRDQLAGLHWLVRYHLWEEQRAYLVVPPSTVKTYATGKGNATKPDMRMALYQRAGIDQPDDNQVDAWWLRALALDHLGHPELDLPQTHRRALTKLPGTS